MSPESKLPRHLNEPGGLGEFLAGAALGCVRDRQKAFRFFRRPRKGAALHPGRDTPLWNALAAEVRPHLRQRGAQAKLGHLLALDRQTVHAFFVGRTRMPDAERTLQLLTWLIAMRQGAPAGKP